MNYFLELIQHFNPLLRTLFTPLRKHMFHQLYLILQKIYRVQNHQIHKY